MQAEAPDASNSKMAAAERIDRGHLGRMLQLTLLAPDLVEAILDARHPDGVGLPRLMEPFPADRHLQRAVLQCAWPAPPPQRCDAAAGTRRPPGAQSTDAPERRTSSATLGSSAAKKAANSPGVLPTGS